MDGAPPEDPGIKSASQLWSPHGQPNGERWPWGGDADELGSGRSGRPARAGRARGRAAGTRCGDALLAAAARRAAVALPVAAEAARAAPAPGRRGRRRGRGEWRTAGRARGPRARVRNLLGPGMLRQGPCALGILRSRCLTALHLQHPGAPVTPMSPGRSGSPQHEGVCASTPLRALPCCPQRPCDETRGGDAPKMAATRTGHHEDGREQVPGDWVALTSASLALGLSSWVEQDSEVSEETPGLSMQ
jgi:hypothetical protein